MPTEPKMQTLISWLKQVSNLEQNAIILDQEIAHCNECMQKLSNIKGPRPVTFVPKDTSFQNEKSEIQKDYLKRIAPVNQNIRSILLAMYFLGWFLSIIWIGCDRGFLYGMGMIFVGFTWPICIVNQLVTTCVFSYTLTMADIYMLVYFAAWFVVPIIYYISQKADANSTRKYKLMIVDKKAKEVENENKTNEQNIQRRNDYIINLREQIREYQKDACKKYADEVAEIEKTCEEVTRARDALYQSGYIHESFRGYVPITSMLLYLESGRCLKLYGDGGAIDTYVRDVQMQEISTQINNLHSGLNNWLSEISSRIESQNAILASGIEQIAHATKDLHRYESTITGLITEQKQILKRQQDDIRSIAVIEKYRYECELRN